MSIYGLMGAVTMVTLNKVIEEVMECTEPAREGWNDMREDTRLTRSGDMAFMFGIMDGAIEEILKMMPEMAWDSSLIAKTEAYTVECGSTDNKVARKRSNFDFKSIQRLNSTS